MVFTPRSSHNSTQLVVSSSHDPWQNLACEEYLLETVRPGGLVLFLYRNRDAVVLGRHQNPWKECVPPSLERMGIPLIRRISGGGTVYHDKGNLNFSFIQDRSLFQKPWNHELVLQALRSLGVSGTVNHRGDLLYEGRKFSGNALCYRKHAVLHHGTLLIKTDLARLAQALAGLNGSVETHAVASEPAPVVNLREVIPDVTVEGVQAQLERTFSDDAGQCERLTEEQVGGLERRAELAETYRSWEWLYGKTPTFTASWTVQLGGETMRISFQVRRGRVTGVSCEDPKLQPELAGQLAGTPFGGPSMHAALAAVSHREDQRLQELGSWLLMQGL